MPIKKNQKPRKLSTHNYDLLFCQQFGSTAGLDDNISLLYAVTCSANGIFNLSCQRNSSGSNDFTKWQCKRTTNTKTKENKSKCINENRTKPNNNTERNETEWNGKLNNLLGVAYSSCSL